MSFPRYERYKDSGVEWLGEVPEHWRIAPLYSLGKEREESNLGLISNNLLSLSYGRIIEKDIETSDGLLPESFETYQIVHPGDIIFRLTDLQNDKRSLRTAIVTQLGIITFAYAAFEPRAIMPAYLSYLLRDYDLRKIFYSMGGGVRQSMKFDDIRRLPTLVPSKNEQSTIVKFLDYETAKIDALIEEQRQLIELLKEKRQAVISHAVTKGLDCRSTMWDSRNKWIGKIPASWTITRVKYAVATVVDCLHTTPTYDGELLYPAIRTADVEPGRLLLSQARLVSEEVYLERVQRLEPETGDILYSREGERFGMAALVPPNTKLCLGQRMMMFRPKVSFDPGYLMWAMNSSTVYQQVLEGVTGPTAPHVNIGEVINFLIPMPELAEQQQISRHIDAVVFQIDGLVAHAQDGIALLQERRSALISGAVTGKIDLRATIAKPVVSANQYSSGFAHQLLAAEILDRYNSQRMGRIKLQKLIHLCEYHGQLSEIQGDYSRKAAGPFDARAMAGISKNLKKQKWFEEVKEGERYVYRSLEKRGEHKKYLAHWQDEMARINEILSLLGHFKTRECEIVSTLYAAWNDLLIDGGSADDAAILHEASSAERWHKSKEQIAPERWKKALQWMKDKGLVPVGYGKHTRHTAGQIGTTTEEAHEPA